MKKLIVIGDVHGKQEAYINLTKDVDYSVQIGDMGSEYDIPDGHWFFPGNHDNYDILGSNPPKGYLGQFGYVTKIPSNPFFFIGGGHSIDQNARREFDAKHNTKSWWSQEELSSDDMSFCKELYLEHKPELLLTHEPPAHISTMFGDPKVLQYFGYPPSWNSDTALFIDELLRLHRPKLVISGHLHKAVNFVEKIGDIKTRFIILPELGVYDINCINRDSEAFKLGASDEERCNNGYGNVECPYDEGSTEEEDYWDGVNSVNCYYR